MRKSLGPLWLDDFTTGEMSLQLDLLSEGQFFGQANLEVEEIVLATFVNYPDTYYEFADQLNVAAFSREETRYIYNCIDVCSKESKVDIVTVTDKLRQKGYVARIAEKSGADLIGYLNDICERVYNDEHLHEHVKLLMSYSTRRELTLLAQLIQEKSNDMVDPEEIINKINSVIVDINEIKDEDEFKPVKVLQQVLHDMTDKEGKNFIKSYISKLDSFIYGWELSDLVVLAGAASMGKTAFALEIVKNHVVRNLPIAIFSLEMSRTQLVTRMVASEACINLGRIRRKEIDQADLEDIHAILSKFQGDNYWIDDKSGDLWKICNKIRKYHMKHGCRFFVIDYLQLISVNLGKKGNREQEIATITRTLKELARELGLVIIALSQINREVTKRSNKRPTLADLRESGAIEQDADMVGFVYRNAYYDIENGVPDIEDVEIIIAKGRSTGIGTVKLKFISQYTKFVSDEEMMWNEKLQTFKNS